MGKSSSRSRRRPKAVTCLCAGVLIFSAVHIAGLVAWFALPDLPLTVPKGYLLIKNAVWALAGSVTAAALFMGAPWGLPLARLSALAIPLWAIADRALFTQSALSRRAFPLVAAASIIGAGLTWWILSRPSAKAFLRSDFHE